MLPTSQVMYSDTLLKDQALAKSKQNCQPGMNLEENTEGKALLTGDKEQKKGSFVGAESSKWAERALEGEQSTEGEQSSPAVPTAHRGAPEQGMCSLPHTSWCLQDRGLCPPAAKVSTWSPEMILQHCGEPVSSTFQLLQGNKYGSSHVYNPSTQSFYILGFQIFFVNIFVFLACLLTSSSIHGSKTLSSMSEFNSE